MKALKSVLLLVQIVVFHAAHAGPLLAADTAREEESTLQDKIKSLDAKVAAAKAKFDSLSEDMDGTDTEWSAQYDFRKDITGRLTDEYGRTNNFKCTDHDSYQPSQCAYRSARGPNYYDSDPCKIYRFCMVQYRKYKVDDASLKKIQDRNGKNYREKNAAELELERLKDERDELMKKASLEKRKALDLAELPEGQTMHFTDFLRLQPAGGNVVDVSGTCSYVLTPEARDDQWWTGGRDRNYEWKFVHVNQTNVEITKVEDCSKPEVHPWRKKACEIGVKMDQRYIVPPSVVMEAKEYPGKVLSVEGESGKTVLNCLYKKGLDPEAVLAKAKPSDSKPAQTAVNESGTTK